MQAQVVEKLLSNIIRQPLMTLLVLRINSFSHHQAAVYPWEFEASFGGRISFLVPTHYRLGKEMLAARKIFSGSWNSATVPVSWDILVASKKLIARNFWTHEKDTAQNNWCSAYDISGCWFIMCAGDIWRETSIWILTVQSSKQWSNQK